MEFIVKCMYLGKRVGTTKNGDNFKELQFLDKVTNDTIKCYVNDFGKFEKMQPYSDVEVKFNFYKDSKNLWRVQLLEV